VKRQIRIGDTQAGRAITGIVLSSMRENVPALDMVLRELSW
jgi:hypothetical protein